jgi:phosphoglycerate kinase
MAQFQTLNQASVTGKFVFLRADLNVPVQDGKISDTTRIDRLKATIDFLHRQGAKTLILSHFGRPKGITPELSQKFMVDDLKKSWGVNVHFVAASIGEDVETAKATLKNGDFLLLENIRFHPEEEKNDPAFARALARQADIFVNDAFSAAHRAHASTAGLAHLLPSYAGFLMEEELNALSLALENPQRPVAAIVGGAKVSTKLDLLHNLVGKVDVMILGGGMANTFLYAQGFQMGKSLCEKDMKDQALAIMAQASQKNCKLILPIDGVCASEFKADADSVISDDQNCSDDRMILDAGPKSVALICKELEACKTIIWNGPVGAFELHPFDKATTAIAKFVANCTENKNCVSVAGGGDTVSALEKAGVSTSMSYISTAGGAFLEWMEGKSLPGVEALRQNQKAA